MSVDANYGLREQVKEELEYAQPHLRASTRSGRSSTSPGARIEETAVIILESLKERDEAARNARAAMV